MRKNTFFTKCVSLFIILTFSLTSVQSPASAQSQGVALPPIGSMLNITQSTAPVILKGLKVNPDNPFQFDFLIDPGQSSMVGDPLKQESTKLIKYFLASLTIPEAEMWVNLSPYEEQRVIPTAFGETEMGRELLAQDYLLKQITSSLIYPEDELGAKFWEKIHQQTGLEDIPVNIFNKVWIIPEEAVVYEGTGVAYVVESRLKVLLEEDYVALEQNSIEGQIENLGPSAQVLREVVIPVLENEVNTGEHFAPLRQIYHSLILASWYKRKLKNSVLTQVYADQKKTQGVVHGDEMAAQKIYDQYIESFKVGVYDFIKEEYDPVTQSIIPRKYFSGGLGFAENLEGALKTTRSAAVLAGDPAMNSNRLLEIDAVFVRPGKEKIIQDAAMTPEMIDHLLTFIKYPLAVLTSYFAFRMANDSFTHDESREIQNRKRFRNRTLISLFILATLVFSHNFLYEKHLESTRIEKNINKSERRIATFDKIIQQRPAHEEELRQRIQKLNESIEQYEMELESQKDKDNAMALEELIYSHKSVVAVVTNVALLSILAGGVFLIAKRKFKRERMVILLSLLVPFIFWIHQTKELSSSLGGAAGLKRHGEMTDLLSEEDAKSKEFTQESEPVQKLFDEKRILEERLESLKKQVESEAGDPAMSTRIRTIAILALLGAATLFLWIRPKHDSQDERERIAQKQAKEAESKNRDRSKLSSKSTRDKSGMKKVKPLFPEGWRNMTEEQREEYRGKVKDELIKGLIDDFINKNVQGAVDDLKDIDKEAVEDGVKKLLSDWREKLEDSHGTELVEGILKEGVSYTPFGFEEYLGTMFVNSLLNNTGDQLSEGFQVAKDLIAPDANGSLNRDDLFAAIRIAGMSGSLAKKNKSIREELNRFLDFVNQNERSERIWNQEGFTTSNYVSLFSLYANNEHFAASLPIINEHFGRETADWLLGQSYGTARVAGVYEVASRLGTQGLATLEAQMLREFDQDQDGEVDYGLRLSMMSRYDVDNSEKSWREMRELYQDRQKSQIRNNQNPAMTAASQQAAADPAMRVGSVVLTVVLLGAALLVLLKRGDDNSTDDREGIASKLAENGAKSDRANLREHSLLGRYFRNKDGNFTSTELEEIVELLLNDQVSFTDEQKVKEHVKDKLRKRISRFSPEIQARLLSVLTIEQWRDGIGLTQRKKNTKESALFKMLWLMEADNSDGEFIFLTPDKRERAQTLWQKFAGEFSSLDLIDNFASESGFFEEVDDPDYMSPYMFLDVMETFVNLPVNEAIVFRMMDHVIENGFSSDILDDIEGVELESYERSLIERSIQSLESRETSRRSYLKESFAMTSTSQQVVDSAMEGDSQQVEEYRNELLVEMQTTIDTLVNQAKKKKKKLTKKSVQHSLARSFLTDLEFIYAEEPEKFQDALALLEEKYLPLVRKGDIVQAPSENIEREIIFITSVPYIKGYQQSRLSRRGFMRQSIGKIITSTHLKYFLGDRQVDLNDLTQRALLGMTPRYPVYEGTHLGGLDYNHDLYLENEASYFLLEAMNLFSPTQREVDALTDRYKNDLKDLYENVKLMAPQEFEAQKQIARESGETFVFMFQGLEGVPLNATLDKYIDIRFREIIFQIAHFVPDQFDKDYEVVKLGDFPVSKSLFQALQSWGMARNVVKRKVMKYVHGLTAIQRDKLRKDLKEALKKKDRVQEDSDSEKSQFSIEEKVAKLRQEIAEKQALFGVLNKENPLLPETYRLSQEIIQLQVSLELLEEIMQFAREAQDFLERPLGEEGPSVGEIATGLTIAGGVVASGQARRAQQSKELVVAETDGKKGEKAAAMTTFSQQAMLDPAMGGEHQDDERTRFFSVPRLIRSLAVVVILTVLALVVNIYDSDVDFFDKDTLKFSEGFIVLLLSVGALSYFGPLLHNLTSEEKSKRRIFRDALSGLVSHQLDKRIKRTHTKVWRNEEFNSRPLSERLEVLRQIALEADRLHNEGVVLTGQDPYHETMIVLAEEAQATDVVFLEANKEKGRQHGELIEAIHDNRRAFKFFLNDSLDFDVDSNNGVTSDGVDHFATFRIELAQFLDKFYPHNNFPSLNEFANALARLRNLAKAAEENFEAQRQDGTDSAMLAKQYQLRLMKTMNDWADQLIAREKPPLDKKIEKLAWEFLDGLQTIMIGDPHELKKLNPIELRKKQLRFQHALELLREQYAHKSSQKFAKSQSINPIREQLYIMAADYAPQFMKSDGLTRREFIKQATGAAIGSVSDGLRKKVAQISTVGLDSLDNIAIKKKRLGELKEALLRGTTFDVSNEGGHGKNLFGNFIHVNVDDTIMFTLTRLGDKLNLFIGNSDEAEFLVEKHRKEVLLRYDDFFNKPEPEARSFTRGLSPYAGKGVEEHNTPVDPILDMRLTAFGYRKRSLHQVLLASDSGTMIEAHPPILESPFEIDLRKWVELRERKINALTRYLQTLSSEELRELEQETDIIPDKQSRFSIEEKAAEIKREIAEKQALLAFMKKEDPLLPAVGVLQEEIERLEAALEPLEEIIRLTQETQEFLERPLGEEGPSVGEIATGLTIAGGVVANGQARRAQQSKELVVVAETDGKKGEKAAAMTADDETPDEEAPDFPVVLGAEVNRRNVLKTLGTGLLRLALRGKFDIPQEGQEKTEQEKGDEKVIWEVLKELEVHDPYNAPVTIFYTTKKHGIYRSMKAALKLNIISKYEQLLIFQENRKALIAIVQQIRRTAEQDLQALKAKAREANEPVSIDVGLARSGWVEDKDKYDTEWFVQVELKRILDEFANGEAAEKIIESASLPEYRKYPSDYKFTRKYDLSSPSIQLLKKRLSTSGRKKRSAVKRLYDYVWPARGISVMNSEEWDSEASTDSPQDSDDSFDRRVREKRKELEKKKELFALIQPEEPLLPGELPLQQEIKRLEEALTPLEAIQDLVQQSVEALSESLEKTPPEEAPPQGNIGLGLLIVNAIFLADQFQRRRASFAMTAASDAAMGVQTDIATGESITVNGREYKWLDDLNIGQRLGGRSDNENKGARQLTLSDQTSAVGLLPEDGTQESLELFLEAMHQLGQNPASAEMFPQIYGLYRNRKGQIEVAMEDLTQGEPTESSHNYFGLTDEQKKTVEAAFTPRALAQFVDDFNFDRTVLDGGNIFFRDGKMRIAPEIDTRVWSDYVLSGSLYQIPLVPHSQIFSYDEEPLKDYQPVDFLKAVGSSNEVETKGNIILIVTDSNSIVEEIKINLRLKIAEKYGFQALSDISYEYLDKVAVRYLTMVMQHVFVETDYIVVSGFDVDEAYKEAQESHPKASHEKLRRISIKEIVEDYEPVEKKSLSWVADYMAQDAKIGERHSQIDRREATVLPQDSRTEVIEQANKISSWKREDLKRQRTHVKSDLYQLEKKEEKLEEKSESFNHNALTWGSSVIGAFLLVFVVLATVLYVSDHGWNWDSMDYFMASALLTVGLGFISPTTIIAARRPGILKQIKANKEEISFLRGQDQKLENQLTKEHRKQTLRTHSILRGWNMQPVGQETPLHFDEHNGGPLLQSQVANEVEIFDDIIDTLRGYLPWVLPDVEIRIQNQEGGWENFPYLTRSPEVLKEQLHEGAQVEVKVKSNEPEAQAIGQMILAIFAQGREAFTDSAMSDTLVQEIHELDQLRQTAFQEKNRYGNLAFRWNVTVLLASVMVALFPLVGSAYLVALRAMEEFTGPVYSLEARVATYFISGSLWVLATGWGLFVKKKGGAYSESEAIFEEQHGALDERISTLIKEGVSEESNAAMDSNVGGIDLNPANWTLKMKGARGGDCADETFDDCLHFNLPAEQIEQMRLEIDGLVPVILNIQPVPSLPIFLGLKDDEIPFDENFPGELDPIREEHAKLEEVS